MNAYAMHSTPTYILAWATRVLLSTVSSIFLLNVPAEFWTQFMAIMEVPEEVKIATAPLLGSAVATAVEYLLEEKGAIHKRWHWPLKIFVGWVAGSYGGPAAEQWVKFTPQTCAFWSGIGGYGVVVLLLAKQKKKLNDTQNGTDPA